MCITTYDKGTGQTPGPFEESETELVLDGVEELAGELLLGLGKRDIEQGRAILLTGCRLPSEEGNQGLPVALLVCLLPNPGPAVAGDGVAYLPGALVMLKCAESIFLYCWRPPLLHQWCKR